MRLVGELHCLSCGRYLADVAEASAGALKLLPAGGAKRPPVELHNGRPFCAHCGGRAFVEYDLTRRTPLSEPAASSDLTAAA